METEQKEKKKLRWWQWLLIIMAVLLAPAILGPKKQKNEIIRITANETGEYGEVITFNEGTENEDKNYIYKLPSGKYKVTTDYSKVGNIFLLEADPVNEETQELNYIDIESQKLTNNPEKFEGIPSELTLTIDDEYIQIKFMEKAKLKFEKIS